MRQLIQAALDEVADEPSSIDNIFFEAALSAARMSKAFKFEKLKRAAANNETTSLIKWLLSDKLLNRRQRIGLARLLAGDYKSKKGRKPLSNKENREYDEMIREWKSQTAEIAADKDITISAAREKVSIYLKNFDLRAGDKTASTIERDLRSNPNNLESRRKRGGSPKRPRLQKIRLK